MDTLTLNSKGQITIPAHVRKSLDLKPGSTLKLYLDPKGKGFTITKTASILDFVGVLPKSKRAYTVEEMNEGMVTAIAKHATSEE